MVLRPLDLIHQFWHPSGLPLTVQAVVILAGIVLRRLNTNDIMYTKLCVFTLTFVNLNTVTKVKQSPLLIYIATNSFVILDEPNIAYIPVILFSKQCI